MSSFTTNLHPDFNDKIHVKLNSHGHSTHWISVVVGGNDITLFIPDHRNIPEIRAACEELTTLLNTPTTKSEAVDVASPPPHNDEEIPF